MNSIQHPRVVDPLGVYETAWAQVEAREPLRDRGRDGNREEALRKLIFAFAGTGHVDFDNLCDSVLASMTEQLIPAEGAAKVGTPGASEAEVPGGSKGRPTPGR